MKERLFERALKNTYRVDGQHHCHIGDAVPRMPPDGPQRDGVQGADDEQDQEAGGPEP